MKDKYLAIGPLPPPIGGDTVSFSRLVESELWEQAGIELIVLDTSRKERESKLVRKLDVLDLHNALRFGWQAWRLRRQVEGVLIWANNRFAYTLGLLFILLYRASGKRVILKLFGGDFAEETSGLPGWWLWLIKLCFTRCHYLLPQTRKLCSYFVSELGIPEERVVHFPNFLPALPRPVKEKELRAPIHAVFVGQIRAEKGIYAILQALELEPRLHCTFYGPIFAEDEPRFRELLAGVPHAHYGGVLHRTEIINTIATYDLLILPTYHPGEGYPAVIVESFFAAVPVIASHWRMIPELVKDGENGFLVRINEPKEIVAVVEQLLANPELYQRLSNGAHRTAEHYSAERVVGEILLPLLNTATHDQKLDLQIEKEGSR